MAKPFDISELEAGIFSEDELQAIDDYARLTNLSEEFGPDSGVAVEEILEQRRLEEAEQEDAWIQEEWDDQEGEFPALELELELENGQTLKCQVVSVFLAGEKEYMALHPVEDTEGMIHIMILEQGENDDIRLLPVEDEAELERAALAFHKFMDDSKLEYEDEMELVDEAAENTEDQPEIEVEEAEDM